MPDVPARKQMTQWQAARRAHWPLDQAPGTPKGAECIAKQSKVAGAGGWGRDGCAGMARRGHAARAQSARQQQAASPLSGDSPG